jgi:hypothetical protein
MSSFFRQTSGRFCGHWVFVCWMRSSQQHTQWPTPDTTLRTLMQRTVVWTTILVVPMVLSVVFLATPGYSEWLYLTGTTTDDHSSDSKNGTKRVPPFGCISRNEWIGMLVASVLLIMTFVMILPQQQLQDGERGFEDEGEEPRQPTPTPPPRSTSRLPQQSMWHCGMARPTIHDTKNHDEYLLTTWQANRFFVGLNLCWWVLAIVTTSRTRNLPTSHTTTVLDDIAYWLGLLGSKAAWPALFD